MKPGQNNKLLINRNIKPITHIFPRFNAFHFTALLLATLFTGGCSLFKAPPPPMTRLQNAQNALDKALRAGAPNLAETEYRKAENLIRIGWQEIGRQNGRLWLLRNYRAADSLLTAAIEAADASTRIAVNTSTDRATKAREAYSELEEQLKQWREALDGTLILYNAERWWSQADMHLRTARRLIKDGEYPEAVNSAQLGRSALARVGALLADQANHEAAHIDQWRREVDETVNWSRTNNTVVIIVDKSAHKTYLLKNGKVIKTFASDVGYNSAGQKLFAGDGATPEGQYRVTKFKDGNSKYYKALLLDYPNSADKQRFASNKRKGIISARAHIGGLIEIHGDGGHGKDWTDGCVALTNSDMDTLCKYAGVGTRVTIVRRYDGNKL